MKNSYFGYKSWMDYSNLMILGHMVNIDETFKLTESQGHKVKVKVEYVFMIFFVLAINHELMNGCSWYLHLWSIMMRCLNWTKVKVTRSKVKVTYAVMQNSCFGYNSWTDEWILMILRHMIDIDETLNLTQGQGHKVKDQGHICNYVKLLFSYKSWAIDSILMILTLMIDIDETLKSTQGQGQKIKGQGHIRIYVRLFFWP